MSDKEYNTNLSKKEYRERKLMLNLEIIQANYLIRDRKLCKKLLLVSRIATKLGLRNER